VSQILYLPFALIILVACAVYVALLYTYAYYYQRISNFISKFRIIKILALIHGTQHQLEYSLADFATDVTVYVSDKKILKICFCKDGKKYRTISSLNGFGDWFFLLCLHHYCGL
jgi:hypothetical protein